MESDGNAHGIFLLNSNAMGMFDSHLSPIHRRPCFIFSVLDLNYDVYKYVACTAMYAHAGEYP